MHLGHRRYLDIIFLIAETVHVSVTSNHFAARLKMYSVKPDSVRQRAIEDYAESRGWRDRLILHLIDDESEISSITMLPNLDIAIVEPKYVDLFQRLNIARGDHGLTPFCTLVKPRTKINGRDLSSTSLENT